MFVNVIGFSKSTAEELTEAAHFFAKILFHPNLARRLSFAIVHVPNMSICGQCSPEDLKCRHFLIEIRAAQHDDPAYSTLAHEMTHCRQWALGQYSTTENIVARKADQGRVTIGTTILELWNGEVWTPNQGEDPYFDSPWEIEAFGRELVMAHRWRTLKEEKEHKNNVSTIVADCGNPSIFSPHGIPPVRPNNWYDTDYYGGA